MPYILFVLLCFLILIIVFHVIVLPFVRRLLLDNAYKIPYVNWLVKGKEGVDEYYIDMDLANFIENKYIIKDCTKAHHVFLHTNLGIAFAIEYEIATKKITRYEQINDLEGINYINNSYMRGVYVDCTRNWRDCMTNDRQIEMSISQIRQNEENDISYRIDEEEGVITITFFGGTWSKAFVLDETYCHPAYSVQLHEKLRQYNNNIEDILPNWALVRKVIDSENQLFNGALNDSGENLLENHPCWDKITRRKSIGKREVTIDKYNNYYLKNIQKLGSEFDERSLKRLYFDCIYDKQSVVNVDNETRARRLKKINNRDGGGNNTDIEETFHSIFSKIICSLKTCSNSKIFSELLQACVTKS